MRASGLKLLSAPVVFIIFWFLLGGLDGQQRAVGAVFAATVALWITEALPLAVTALLSTTSLVLIAGIPEKEAFAAYGDVVVPLFIGSFMLAKAMERTGLSDRFAWLILSRRWATASPALLLLALGLIACVLSLFVSNTATTAMMLPIGLSILAVLKQGDRGAPFNIGVMLMLTWGSSIAVGFPVGTPPNMIGIRELEKQAGIKIGFIDWMTFAMPVTIVMMFASWGVLWWMFRRGAPDTRGASSSADEARDKLGKIKRSEINTLVAFSVSLSLWILPDLSVSILGKDHAWASWLTAHIPASVAALVGAGLLFLLRDQDGEQTLPWKQAATIDWGTILLFAGGIALGNAMSSSGLAATTGKWLSEVSGASSTWSIAALCIGAAIALSELASNTAAATTLMPIAIGLATAAGANPVPAALGVALGASMGFMLPVSTPPNAIVYSSGLVPPRQMIRAGFVIDVIGFFVILGCLRAILPLMGLA